MTNNVGCIHIGRQFLFGKTTYVKIPQMATVCGEIGFTINVIRVEWSTDDPILIADFLHPDTLVKLI